MTKKPPKKFKITHHLVTEPSDLISFLIHVSKLDFVKARHLIEFGAVYVNEARETHNVSLKTGDYIRVHHEPKRFYVPSVDWEKRIMYQDQGIIVVDKPSGIPVHPTLDNGQENILHQLRKYLDQDLFITHRLDIGTSGLLILAKSLASQKNINRLFETKQIQKFYSAIVSSRIDARKLIHYMLPSPRSPKTLSADPIPGWKICELEIIKSKPIFDDFYGLDIQLLTGRSHQIRAQLAASGAPIVGDTLYGGLPKTKAFEFYYLRCVRLTIPSYLDVSVPDMASEFAQEALPSQSTY